jgi:hypothetical protein
MTENVDNDAFLNQISLTLGTNLNLEARRADRLSNEQTQY